jgi:hypothetical protein
MIIILIRGMVDQAMGHLTNTLPRVIVLTIIITVDKKALEEAEVDILIIPI